MDYITICYFQHVHSLCASMLPEAELKKARQARTDVWLRVIAVWLKQKHRVLMGTLQEQECVSTKPLEIQAKQLLYLSFHFPGCHWCHWSVFSLLSTPLGEDLGWEGRASEGNRPAPQAAQGWGVGHPAIHLGALGVFQSRVGEFCGVSAKKHGIVFFFGWSEIVKYTSLWVNGWLSWDDFP